MEEKKEEGTCGKGGCGIHCGCCCCKAIKGLVLLLIGGAIGYGIGRGCGSSRMCPLQSGVSAPSQSAPAPAAAPAKAK